MDIASVVGMLLGIGLVLTAIVLKTSIMTFIDTASLAVVAGGALSAALISFPLGHVFKIVSIVKKVFFAEAQDPVRHVKALVELAEVARRDGILSLESQLTKEGLDEFLVRGLRMAIDGQDPGVIQDAMEKEVETVMERHSRGKALFDNIGKYAPAFGMIGTLIGLVIMLQNMDDPAALGPAMAVALITTFYGSLIANLFAMPLADKLAVRSEDEIASKILIIRGVMSIQAGDNPRIVQQKLMAFLSGPQRLEIEKESGEGEA